MNTAFIGRWFCSSEKLVAKAGCPNNEPEAQRQARRQVFTPPALIAFARQMPRQAALNCLSVGLAVMVTGCKLESDTEANIGQADQIRHIGPHGAVVGKDIFGRPSSLKPGTTVRPTHSTDHDKQVFIVTEGKMVGMAVSLAESDLE